MKPQNVLTSWARVLGGHTPILSIEITKECPLRCPGCYAYGDDHLGGDVTLKRLSDYKGDELVERVLALVQRHQPLHVSLVGGEPLMRHRELSRILPELSAQNRYVMVVTSAVIPIPEEWMSLAHLTVAISIDGLPEHHDVRRAPATYERILKNIAGRRVNVHGTITRQMLGSREYLEEYVRFWNEQAEVDKIWFSIYSPQVGEDSPEMLRAGDRERLRDWLGVIRPKYKKLLVPEGMADAYINPPESPAKCTFARMSANYTADLETRIEPCVFGGNPDCSQCGCSASAALHWIQNVRVAGPLRAGHLLGPSIRIGQGVRRLRGLAAERRWNGEVAPPDKPAEKKDALVQIR